MMVVAGLAFLALNEFLGNAGGDISVDGMKCGAQMSGYHVHAHLAMFDAGQEIYLYPGIGWSDAGHCWYWLHTHDGSGAIHVEGPNSTFNPTLSKFFDVWHEPLSRTRLVVYKVKPGQSMRVYVNQKPYTGNPRNILLQRHTTVTIDIGPPFPPPLKYNFGKL
jgi:hypothetical protein